MSFVGTLPPLCATEPLLGMAGGGMALLWFAAYRAVRKDKPALGAWPLNLAFGACMLAALLDALGLSFSLCTSLAGLALLAFVASAPKVAHGWRGRLFRALHIGLCGLYLTAVVISFSAASTCALACAVGIFYAFLRDRLRLARSLKDELAAMSGRVIALETSLKLARAAGGIPALKAGHATGEASGDNGSKAG